MGIVPLVMIGAILMNNPWQIIRKLPYTAIGILRKKCIRCGNPAHVQWQICSDGNNYRPLCLDCDIDLNAMVLKWAKHPHAVQLSIEYAKEQRNENN